LSDISATKVQPNLARVGSVTFRNVVYELREVVALVRSPAQVLAGQDGRFRAV